MNIWKTIQRLKIKQLFVLSKTLLKNPNYILPTYKATKETLKICDKKFGESHHHNNKANAFRHALWNFLIAEKCFQKNNSVEKAIAWAKEITDLHENLSPNKALAKTMDLHNNQIGRALFRQKNASKKSLEILQQKMKKAVKISSTEEAKTHINNLIYLKEDER